MSSYYNFKATDYTWHKNKKGLYVIDNDFYITLEDENKNSYVYKIKKGFTTDGRFNTKSFSMVC